MTADLGRICIPELSGGPVMAAWAYASAGLACPAYADLPRTTPADWDQWCITRGWAS